MCEWAGSQVGTTVRSTDPLAAWNEHSHCGSCRSRYIFCFVQRCGAAHDRLNESILHARIDRKCMLAFRITLPQA